MAARQLLDEPGLPVLISARDVSDDLAAARQLAASEQQWRVAFEHSPIGGAMLSPAGAILVANQALSRMVGWRVHQLTQMDVTDIVDSKGGLPWQKWWDDLLAGGCETSTTDRTLIAADGRKLWSRLTGAVVASSSDADRVIMQFEDVTSRRQAELELANRALHDGLTGVPNRFLTHQWLRSALEDQPGSRVGVLYCDVDRFKIVNDSLGHAAGDSLLTQVVDRLRTVLRPQDLLGRVGGDEFVVIVEGVRTTAELAEVASRMAEALDEPFDLGGHRHVVTLSLGGSIGLHQDTADEVLRRADMALMRAKRLGRARYVAFDEVQDHVTTRADLQLEDDLRISLGSEQLRAYYQPIVELRELSVVGHEALVRWQHPTHGLLPPDRFVELAESSGLIRPLGRWMLAQACQDAANDAAGLTPGGWVAVNVSPRQLERSGFADHVIDQLAASGLSPGRLHLEVTETALITASANLSDELEQLSRLGVRIGLDDFGTGYSSLSLLQKFPVHLVKIDRSFVHPVLTDRSARAIVIAVLSMCQDMGLPTVAEGIENAAQLDLLRELGCSHGAGLPVRAADPAPGPCPCPPAGHSPDAPGRPRPNRARPQRQMNRAPDHDEFASQEVIRPAAVLSETHARLILAGLMADDVQAGGYWWTRVGTWRRYAKPWADGADDPGDAVHIGTISCVYDSPARFCVTVFRVSMTSHGLRQGWTTESLCDEAFKHAGLTLKDCPRASLSAPPRPFNPLARDTGWPR